jgi:hypothetical protein
MLRRPGRPAHKESLRIVNTSSIELIGRATCCVFFETHGGAVPASAFSYKNSFKLVGGKGARPTKVSRFGKFQWHESISTIVDDKNCLFKFAAALKSDQLRKTVSNLPITMRRNAPLVVDVDDKNWLAELTVALKLNQGVRQWLYIIGGVLFFVTFFCTSKRK